MNYIAAVKFMKTILENSGNIEIMYYTIICCLDSFQGDRTVDTMVFDN